MQYYLQCLCYVPRTVTVTDVGFFSLPYADGSAGGLELKGLRFREVRLLTACHIGKQQNRDRKQRLV